MFDAGTTLSMSSVSGLFMRAVVQMVDEPVVHVAIEDDAEGEFAKGDLVDLTIVREGDAAYVRHGVITRLVDRRADVRMQGEVERVQRRRFLRMAEPVTAFVLRRDGDGRLASSHSVTTRDLSAGGMSIAATVPFDIGERVQVRLAIGAPMLLEAVVVRVSVSGIGIGFDRLPVDDEQRLVTFVNRIQLRSRTT
jgi:hypothetical protein